MVKQKHIILIVIMLLSVNLHSQVLLSLIFGDKLNSEGLEFGLEGGMNWANISNLDADKSLSAFNLGFYFDFKLKNQWNLYTGVLVKAKMGDLNLSEDDLVFLEVTPNAEAVDPEHEIVPYF
jgi:hypothetical protein